MTFLAFAPAWSDSDGVLKIASIVSAASDSMSLVAWLETSCAIRIEAWAKRLLNRCHWHAGRMQQGRSGVAEIVEADLGNSPRFRIL